MHNIIFFASGRGSNISAILQYFQDKNYINPSLIVSNNENSGAIAIAKSNNIPHLPINKDLFFTDNFLEVLKNKKPDLIVLAGFLWKMPENIIQAFPNKIINIHPSLLPKYGGKGMYGANVHNAVIDARENESGITIHYVNEHYDKGNIIVQAHCALDEQDTAVTLAGKIRELEHFYFPRTIEFLLNS